MPGTVRFLLFFGQDRDDVRTRDVDLLRHEVHRYEGTGNVRHCRFDLVSFSIDDCNVVERRACHKDEVCNRVKIDAVGRVSNRDARYRSAVLVQHFGR